MALPPPSRRLPRELRRLDVWALATGATLSSGLFLLPGPAAALVGPALVLAYAIAAIPMVPAMFSVVELATAMPRAGGAYYFLDRSLGPLFGTIGGLGTWLALVLKTAFALVGMGAYLALFLPGIPGRAAAVALAVAFAALNLLGARRTGGFQRVLVAGLLLILAAFVLRGLPAIEPARFSGFLDAGFEALLATSGLVYISYVGITKVASVSEEVHDPERSLPWGVFLALATAALLYALCTLVLVGVLPREVLAGHLTPVAEAATRLAGPAGGTALALAALLAFASVSNAGILSSSRYPLAMSRDELLPAARGGVSRRGVPTAGVLVTLGAILVFLLVLDPVGIAKLASAFQLAIFALLCGAVIVMRESGLDSYDPGFRSPGYPWMQIAGIVAAAVLIAAMGWLPRLFSLALFAGGALWYYAWARGHVERRGAIFHVFERLGRARYAGLDRELRGILKEKGPREEDSFEHVIAHAIVVDTDRTTTYETLVGQVSRSLAERLGLAPKKLEAGFLEGTRVGATPVAGGVALPHMRLSGLAHPLLALARSRRGLRIEIGDHLGATHLSEPAHAIFFLVSPEEDPGQHLRLLAHLASRAEEGHFVAEWLAARDAHALRETLLHHERFHVLTLRRDAPSAGLCGRALRHVTLPAGCLVAVVRRGDETLIPRGQTVLRAGDVLTVIGEPAAIREVRRTLG